MIIFTKSIRFFLSKIIRSVQLWSFSKLKMHNFHEKWQFSLKYPNFPSKMFNYGRSFSRKSRQNNNFHLNWDKSEAKFSTKITLLIWNYRFFIKYTQFEMVRSKFWLKMTIFKKNSAKWQFWFEIGVFWRVGILGMVPDLIRKILEWFGMIQG